MKVWILEDEPRAARRMVRMLEDISSEIIPEKVLESVAEACSWSESATLSPTLIISDIQLADGLSFDYFKQFPPTCPVIFTTAYDQYALQAFQSNGVDYLLKPVHPDELAKAIAKARKLQAPSSIDLEQLRSLVSGPKRFKERFMVRAGEKIRSVSVDEVSCIYSEDKHTMLRSGHREYVLDQSLDALEDVLSDQAFFRISRKFIVAHQAIEEAVVYSNSRLKITLSEFDRNDLIVARDRVSAFRAWMDR